MMYPACEAVAIKAKVMQAVGKVKGNMLKSVTSKE